MSYLFHLDATACRAGAFRSHYWTALPKALYGAGWRANWLQRYLRSDALPTASVAMAWTSAFNRERDREGFHSFVDAFLSWRVVGRVVAGWLALIGRSVGLRRVRDAFRPAGYRVSLWPVLREDWFASMRGPLAVENLLAIESYDAAMRAMPRQPVGVYLCENQAWERAMIHAWRKYGHGRLTAFAHSTIRFWDLRYFTDARTMAVPSACGIPRADVLALNGRAQLDAYQRSPAPHFAVAECESLRYDYLRGWAHGTAARGAATTAHRVLVLGDYSASETHRMLDLLTAARGRLPSETRFTLRPHPAQPIDVSRYPTLRLAVVREPLDRVLADFDVVYASNSTSAAVDAYLAGLPVIIMLDDTQFNFSPLRGHHGAWFVSTPEEVVDGLVALGTRRATQPASRDFFFLDPDLPRWKRLLDVN